MPRCINNCYNLESFWKNWHASFNKWIVRLAFNLFTLSISSPFFLKIVSYEMYTPLWSSERELLNIWIIIFLFLQNLFLGTCTFLLGVLRESFWIYGLFSHLLLYGMTWSGTTCFSKFPNVTFSLTEKRSVKVLNPTPHLTVCWFGR